jgi:enoyl-CoA hydratase/carnithine racemase
LELALTAREVVGDEALRLGLVSRCLPDQAALMEAVQQVAAGLALKPSLALVGTKRVMLHSRCAGRPPGGTLQQLAACRPAPSQPGPRAWACAAACSGAAQCSSSARAPPGLG